MALDADRRALLERSRAEGLLRSSFDLDPSLLELTSAPFGIIARDDDRAWIVSMSDDLAVLGGALVWIDRHSPAEVDLVVEHHGGIHARRAAVLAPECRVWTSSGGVVVAAVPEPIPEPLPRPDDAAHFEAALVELGLDVVCEDGILRGEIAGLEVARILHGPDGPVLEAGVGRFDREAGVLLHAGRSPIEAVADAAAQVWPHRTPGAVSHAVNRLARERWLRAIVVADPIAFDIDLPALVEPVPPRANLLEAVPAAVFGTDDDRSVLLVCSVGVDLGLIPAIADLMVAHAPDIVRIVVPVRDRLPHLERLATRLPVPTEIRVIETPWVD
ncbi:MAG: hypothetical protein R2707_09465 [Acidimicrobiales bacterium]